jgi:uncharacterized protein
MAIGKMRKGWLVVLVLLLAQLPVKSFAESRMALVIGMSDYKNVVTLPNAAGDAEGIGKTLEKLGFKVTEAVNQPLPELVSTINNFSFRAETADIALIYYAGHGVEFAGENFLIPVDVHLADLKDVTEQAIPADSLLDAVRSARRLRVVILDSCRNNPFADVTGGRSLNVPIASGTPVADTIRRAGLAPPSPENGTLVVYAAKAGEVAFDGKEGHSPLARALMEQLPGSGVEIDMMFRRVRDEVMRDTENQQEPHFYGSLSSIPLFLAGPEANVALAADPRRAWGSLAPAQREQLASLATQGNVRALTGLGYMALDPDKSRFEPDKAFDYFSRAAEAGDGEAMFELAKLYEKGIGTPQNFDKALALYRQSADKGFADAINDLGFFYYQGATGVARDQKKAVEMFLRAADLKHPQAMYNVAALIDDGVIAGKTPRDAAHYLYLALRSGVSDVLDQLTQRPDQFKLPTRKALQALLVSNGFYDGGVDGSFGNATKRGLRLAYGDETPN